MSSLDRLVVSEHEMPQTMNWRLVEEWAAIPSYSKTDTTHPEWPKAEVIQIELPGFKEVRVMDEGNRRVNPRGTFKDRLAWEMVGVYRDFARSLEMQRKSINGSIHETTVPRMTILTSLNAGDAIASAFATYELPPPKLLISDKLIEASKPLQGIADIYATDLRVGKLHGTEIKELTNNTQGIDLTTIMMIEPQATFYDWLAHYALNEKADNIIVQDGSGRLKENLMTWQHRNARDLTRYRAADPRLQCDYESLVQTSIIGVKPSSQNSRADKLTAPFNHAIYDGNDAVAGRQLGFTGRKTGTYFIPEEHLLRGYDILQQVMSTSISGAAGVGGLLFLAEQGIISRGETHLIINTGKGNYEL